MKDRAFCELRGGPLVIIGGHEGTDQLLDEELFGPITDKINETFGLELQLGEDMLCEHVPSAKPANRGKALRLEIDLGFVSLGGDRSHEDPEADGEKCKKLVPECLEILANLIGRHEEYLGQTKWAGVKLSASCGIFYS